MKQKNWRMRGILLILAIGFVGISLLCCLQSGLGEFGVYAFYHWLTRQRQNDYKALNDQAFAELPIYPGATAVCVYQRMASNLNILEYRSDITPSIHVAYGLEEIVSEEEIVSYLASSLREIGWQLIRDDVSAAFIKNKQCYMIFEGDFVWGVPSECRDELAHYPTRYEIVITADIDAVTSLPWFTEGISYYKRCPSPSHGGWQLVPAIRP